MKKFTAVILAAGLAVTIATPAAASPQSTFAKQLLIWIQGKLIPPVPPSEEQGKLSPPWPSSEEQGRVSPPWPAPTTTSSSSSPAPVPTGKLSPPLPVT